MFQKILFKFAKFLGFTIGISKAILVFFIPKIIPTVILIILWIFTGLREVSVEFKDGVVFKIPDINKVWRKKDHE